jgi:uncharacterized Zn finger protein
MSFTEVESSDQTKIALRCPECENVIKKRRDSFLVGLHVAFCALCGHSSSAIDTLEGEHVEVTADAHKQPDDFAGKKS